MGSPLGPTLADIFLGYHERRWLDNCPLTFKPVLYIRYIDHTFLLFSNESHIQNFLNYLNSQHQSIEFTCETENNCRLNFLDKTIHINTKFETSLFRKDSLTNLGMKFNSFIPNFYKNNLISCLRGVISAKMVKIIKFLFFAQKVSSGMGALRPKFLGG